MLKLWPSFLSSFPYTSLTHRIGCNWQGERNVAFLSTSGHPNSLISSIYECNQRASLASSKAFIMRHTVWLIKTRTSQRPLSFQSSHPTGFAQNTREKTFTPARLALSDLNRSEAVNFSGKRTEPVAAQLADPAGHLSASWTLSSLPWYQSILVTW